MHQFLEDSLAHHGYWVLFLWAFLEGEAGLIFAGFLAYRGYLSVGGVIVTAAAGSFLGDQFYFYLGRWQGRRLLGFFSRIARKFRGALGLIERYGTFVAFVSRFTYGFRIILPTMLGMSSFPAGMFLRLNLLSALTWSSIFALAGYLFGKSASLLVDDVSRSEEYLLVLLACLILFVWGVHYVVARRRRPARARLARMKRRRNG